MAAGVSKETQMSIEASSMFPGFRFSPTDAELISYYLKKKMEGADKCVEVIAEVEICKYEPWDLPAKSVMQSDSEWFFFSARGRKYPNGSQSKRATELGYWKATGKERNVKSGNNVIGTKRTLVFHMGRAPKGERTEWIMHEYCMHGRSQDSLVVCRLRKNAEFRQSENTNRNRTDLSNEPCSSNAVIDANEGDKAAECSKKCSSSYDSHSIEQLDSAAESDPKLLDDVALAESSSHQKDSDYEEDFFADILKDDIIKLDETSFPSTPDLLPIVSKSSTTPLQASELLLSQADPLPPTPHQGTANRRLKMKWPAAADTNIEEAFAQTSISNRADEEKSERPPDAPSTCVFGLFNVKLDTRRKIISVFCILLSVLVLLLSLLGGSYEVKRILSAIP